MCVRKRGSSNGMLSVIRPWGREGISFSSHLGMIARERKKIHTHTHTHRHESSSTSPLFRSMRREMG